MSGKKPKYVELKTVEALNALHTGTLLSRLEKLRSLPEKQSHSDYSPEEVVQHGGMILFKDSDLWRAAMTALKPVLADREHIPRGGKEARRAAMREKKHR